MNFEILINNIHNLQTELQQQALRSVNQALTIRNWLIGFYIVEYEQQGQDRAQYGEKLLQKLAQELTKKRLKGFSYRSLRQYRQFYLSYPQIWQSLTAKLQEGALQLPPAIVKALPKNIHISASNSTAIAKYSPKPDILVKYFTFTHFAELISIEDPMKRAFYEIEGIKGNWSVRQLKRQIESLLFERTGLSTDKAGLLKDVQKLNTKFDISDTIRDPYILEFTGLEERPKYNESDLETALLDHIQEFLLELGNGFCFEARQKRITIDNEHDRIDLVFYHRILKCHLLIDLKTRKFKHDDAGQMNFYLNYFKNEVMADNDNLPVGLILCTAKNETKVQYATAGLDGKIFVSKYLVQLPSEKELEEFIKKDRQRIEEAQQIYNKQKLIAE